MPDTLRLSWDCPADRWEAAVPLGNGRIGAMAFGGPSARYALNDATVWSGTPDGPARALHEVLAHGAGPERLADVRRALDAGRVRDAEALLMAFEGPYSQEFLPLADLRIAIPGARAAAPVRILDLDDAVLTETLLTDNGPVRRRSWVSAPAGALIVELTGEAEFAVDLALSTPLHGAAHEHGIGLDVIAPVDGAPLHEAPAAPHRYATSDDDFDAFASVAVALDTDGFVEATPSGARLHGVRRLLIALSTSSRAGLWWADADGEWRTASREAIRDRARKQADAAAHRSASDLVDEHVADRRRQAQARFAIGGRREGTWDVDRDVLHGADPALRATVIAEYGTYLLLSASRDGSPPANLQGIWNDQLRPAWSSNYTININTQMNYWAAPLLGLDDSFEPLLALVEHVARNGREVARKLYGARGWVAHHNTDLWGWALPVGNGRGAASWAIWMMGGVWLTHNLWDAYAFGGDRGLLRTRIWPLLRGAAEFCLDWLIAGPDGALRTSPSTSPENSFVAADGANTALGHTAASDLFLIAALFERTLIALEDLRLEDPLRDEIEAALAALARAWIDSRGRLQEWSADVEEAEPLHRHLSPLIGMYPLDVLTRDRDPLLFEAGIRLLDARGPGAMGWSWAWKIALRARIGDGEAAAALLEEALTPFGGDASRHGPVDGSEWGGLLPNLFSTHPPFQIDGNLGFPAAIAEMLVQSHEGVVALLPALPSTWPDGDVQGIRARTGLRVDLSWRGGALAASTIHNALPVPRRVTVGWEGRRISLVAPGHGSIELSIADFERGEQDAR
ncbi:MULTISPECIES: glycoside hydrolase N-terminal domain-containing protein [unclassified Microbacterium]|uniref:glycosyl hydrolase family 95 catalytic domain-containing protein n=1 Tax=unclassified Microbacterium TaxID=2609290 RepID=UPI00364A7DBA